MARTPIDGRVDQMTRRNNADALQGMPALIDTSYAGVAQAFTDAGITGIPADGRRIGCVYLEPAAIGGDGYPTSAICRLSGGAGQNSGGRVVVPYAALAPNLPSP